jgi:hypothetical protein
VLERRHAELGTDLLRKRTPYSRRAVADGVDTVAELLRAARLDEGALLDALEREHGRSLPTGPGTA